LAGLEEKNFREETARAKHPALAFPGKKGMEAKEFA